MTRREMWDLSEDLFDLGLKDAEMYLKFNLLELSRYCWTTAWGTDSRRTAMTAEGQRLSLLLRKDW